VQEISFLCSSTTCLCARVFVLSENEEKYSFLVLAAFFVNDRSECSKIETLRVKSK